MTPVTMPGCVNWELETPWEREMKMVEMEDPVTWLKAKAHWGKRGKDIAPSNIYMVR